MLFSVNSLIATLTAIVDGVAEILIVLHNFYIIWFVEEERASSPF